MFRQVMKSKIHGAVITKKELGYNGSIGIDTALLRESDIIAGEKVQVLNFNNGRRFETYVIEEADGSGIIALYGPAARLGEIGDMICIISYAFMHDDEIGTARRGVLILTRQNKISQ
ncbi:MAG: aspartate 1-decarboxylase [Candidatus Omnitrophica bacterium]|nr:aspartate 1-decarboxylase [Candidatus Omnitrophota bacterium]